MVTDPAHPAPSGSAWAAVTSALRASRRVLLVLHVRPDGDSIGCSLAVARGLRAIGKQAVVVSPDPIPANLAFLDPDRECVAPDKAAGPFDVALFLDCADLERIGTARTLLGEIPVVINIDHHRSNECYGTVNYVDPDAAACGEVALRLCDALSVPVDARAATALFAALATDTGGFRYGATTAVTLAMASRLRAAGADLALVGHEVWDSRSAGSLRLLAVALNSLGTDGELAWVSLRASDLASSADPGDSEGLVDYPRSLRGVEVAALFAADQPGRVRVSLRSNRRVDVSRLAQAFGGGGHARAAGCTVEGDLETVRNHVLDAARAALQPEGLS